MAASQMGCGLKVPSAARLQNQASPEVSPALGEVEWTLPVDSSPDNKLHEEDQQ